VRSFAGKVRRRAEAIYVFVAEDAANRRIAGASVIVAKHGTPDSPHYYLEVAEEERYSRTLRRLFRHTYLHLRRSFDGPTEVGGLVVDPAYRGSRERVGKQLSYVRFLYMGLHPDRFEPFVLAEMLPPLTAAGASPLWECYGRRVTGLSFHDADVLSRRDKEFIDALFPQAPIYVCMLPEEVRDQIGVVGPQSAPALHVLERVGFRFLHQIDPFDGGPYWGAPLEDIAVIKRLRHLVVRVVHPATVPVRVGLGRDAGREALLVAPENGAELRALRLQARVLADEILLAPEDAAALGLGTGRRVAVVPFV
jgi:arginine N-succinyltransferase